MATKSIPVSPTNWLLKTLKLNVVSLILHNYTQTQEN